MNESAPEKQASSVPEQAIEVFFNEEDSARIDALARERGATREEMILQLVNVGLDEHTRARGRGAVAWVLLAAIAIIVITVGLTVLYTTEQTRLRALP